MVSLWHGSVPVLKIWGKRQAIFAAQDDTYAIGECACRLSAMLVPEERMGKHKLGSQGAKAVRTRQNLRLILHLWLCKYSLIFVSFLSFSISSFFISRAWTTNGKELLPSCALAPFTSHFLNAGSI